MGRIQRFLKMESSGGMVLMFAAVAAMLCANSSLSPFYSYFFGEHSPVAEPLLIFGVSLIHLINDGLMALFFLLVGLEIKREVLEGELSTRKKALLPLIAAVGGVLAPAVIYVLMNHDSPVALRGWAIPTATDIAFSLGVLSLFGKRVPLALKVFLTALAIIDDLFAILIIAVVYSEAIHLWSLLGALGCVVVLWLMQKRGISQLPLYLLVGIGLWLAVLFSGVHATIAGVVLGLMIPLTIQRGEREAHPLHRLEKRLHPWVAYGVMPLFAFANSGVSLEGLSLEHLLLPVPLGIALGLFLGKQIGIALFSFIAVRLGIAQLPTHVSWRQFYAVCVACGIGFTMSLFIGGLSFSQILQAETKLGVLMGSLMSGLLACVLLNLWLPKKAP